MMIVKERERARSKVVFLLRTEFTGGDLVWMDDLVKIKKSLVFRLKKTICRIINKVPAYHKIPPRSLRNLITLNMFYKGETWGVCAIG